MTCSTVMRENPPNKGYRDTVVDSEAFFIRHFFHCARYQLIFLSLQRKDSF